METSGHGPLPAVSLGSLQPYVSVLLLEPVAGDVGAVFAECASFLREPASSRTRARVTLVAEGVDEDGGRLAPLEDVTALVHRVERSPGWQVPGSAFEDALHALTVIARSHDLVAVLTDSMWSDRLQRWLDRPGRAGRRVADDVLQYAFLRGEARGLWLRGAHAPRTTKPDSKMSAGRRLQDSLDPIIDGTYSLASGRAALVADVERIALRTSVGTTPNRGLVWCRRAESMADYAQVLGELFEEVRRARSTPAADRSVFTQLAGRMHDLSDVRGAYELGCNGLEAAPVIDADQETARAAVDLIERTAFAVRGNVHDPSFLVDVEVDGRAVGVIHGQVVENSRRRELDLNLFGEPRDPPVALQVMEALRFHRDLLTVHYRSEHAYVHGDVVVSRIRPARFPGWEWRSFAGFRVDREKPAGNVHELVGMPDDNSLFGWVVRECRDGWLTCDDGPGEVADFVHVAASGTLRIIHVKAARGRGRVRGVSAAAYEVVVGQAVKNLPLVDDAGLLLARLERPGTARSATWHDGIRMPDRSGFLAELRRISRVRDTQVVIVQPHVREAAYRRTLALADVPGGGELPDDLLRLYLLESLLNGASSGVVARGAGLVSIGDAG